jgi:hypothetical protein
MPCRDLVLQPARREARQLRFANCVLLEVFVPDGREDFAPCAPKQIGATNAPEKLLVTDQAGSGVVER